MDQILKWYALRVRPHHEKVVETSVRQKGYETFLPLLPPHPGAAQPAKKPHETPLFPGYVFCRFDVHRRLPVLVTPGVAYIVGVGRTPAPVEDSEIDNVRRVLNSQLPAERWKYLRMGQDVAIQVGPLAGVQGVIVRQDTKHRIVVSITLLQRSLAVQIEPAWVIPLNEAPINPGADASRSAPPPRRMSAAAR